jgi:hypothetical protein
VEGANLSAYSLPIVRDIKTAILASLAFIELCPAVIWPLLGGVYRAPLGEWCPVTTNLLFTGATGVGKTTMALLGQNHYGLLPGCRTIGRAPPMRWSTQSLSLRTAWC